jgi:hypothetical protein
MAAARVPLHRAVDALIEATRAGVRFVAAGDTVVADQPRGKSMAPDLRAKLVANRDQIAVICGRVRRLAGQLPTTAAAPKELGVPPAFWLGCSDCGDVQLLPRRELGRTCRMTLGCKGVLCVEVVTDHPLIDAARQHALTRLAVGLESPTGPRLTVEEIAAVVGGDVVHADHGHGHGHDHLGHGDAA